MNQIPDWEFVRLKTEIKFESDGSTFKAGTLGIVLKDSPAENHYIVNFGLSKGSYDVSADVLEVLQGYGELEKMRHHVRGLEHTISFLMEQYITRGQELDKKYGVDQRERRRVETVLDHSSTLL